MEGETGSTDRLNLGAVAHRADHRGPHDGVVMIASAAARIEAGPKAAGWSAAVDSGVIGRFGVVALILAPLHGLEATLWAAGYVWLSAISSFTDALLSPNAVTTLGMGVELPLVAVLQHGGSSERHTTVQHQHGLHFRDSAGLLAAALRRGSHGCIFTHADGLAAPRTDRTLWVISTGRTSFRLAVNHTGSGSTGAEASV